MKGLGSVLFLFLFLILSTPAATQTLTFEQRVEAQERIERVYYNHRIWPETNRGTKPSFEELVPRRVIEQKVLDSLQKLTEAQITSEELQAELNRIAKTTQDPSMLKELFKALKNDPVMIVETLVRPIVTHRLMNESPVVRRTKRQTSEKNYKLPKINSGTNCEGWETLDASNPPSPRANHTAIWIGTEMIVWGGSELNTGGRYDPALNSWTPTSVGTNVPAARSAHSAVWTGSEMIVWGGYDSNSELMTGGRYNPVGDTWNSTSVGANVPSNRSYHTAVWTGTEMIIWGGGDPACCLQNTGGRYNPSTDSWQQTSTGLNLPIQRAFHTAVWTGQEMIVWGGLYNDEYTTSSGGRYNPNLDTWQPTSFTNVPEFRFLHTAIWTGSEMIIWGGRFNKEYESTTNTGGKYDPSNDSWVATSTLPGVPFYRNQHTAVWTGSEMIIWSGFFYGLKLKTGGNYSLANDTWDATAIGVNAPSGRTGHTAIWTGTKMIAWGGRDSFDTDTGGIYLPETDFINVNPAALPQAVVNTPYSETVSASGGSTPYNMTISDYQLPSWLSFDASTGVIHGTPSENEEELGYFAITATDMNGCIGTQGYYVPVCPDITLSPGEAPTGEVGLAYNLHIIAAGGVAPYTFAVTAGSLPDGLTLDSSSGIISGTPTTVGTSNFTIMASDLVACSKAISYTISISLACIFCDDFEDGVLDPNWTEVKPGWTESGGFLVGTPANRKAAIIATPIFNGCLVCSQESAIMTTGGVNNKVWLLGWYLNKQNTMELLLNEEKDVIILKQRVNGSIITKNKGTITLAPNTAYVVKVDYNGTVFTVSVDGTPLFTLTPATSVPTGTIGFQVKNGTASFGYITVN